MTVISVDRVKPSPKVSPSIPALRITDGIEPASAPIDAPKATKTAVSVLRCEEEGERETCIW